MENKILGQFRFIFFGKLTVYQDRVEFTSLVKKEIIPANKIANVSYNKLTNQFIIETTGGGKIKVGFWSWSRRKVGEEALKLVSSLKG